MSKNRGFEAVIKEAHLNDKVLIKIFKALKKGNEPKCVEIIDALKISSKAKILVALSAMYSTCKVEFGPSGIVKALLAGLGKND